MIKYHISKYSPQYRNEKGEYTRNDWTSYADIGKKYEFGQLTLKEYITIENNYGKVIEMIFLENNIYVRFATAKCVLVLRGGEKPASRILRLTGGLWRFVPPPPFPGFTV